MNRDSDAQILLAIAHLTKRVHAVEDRLGMTYLNGEYVEPAYSNLEYREPLIQSEQVKAAQENTKFLARQIDELANVIMSEFPRSIVHGGACDTAIRIMRDQAKMIEELKAQNDELKRDLRSRYR